MDVVQRIFHTIGVMGSREEELKRMAKRWKKAHKDARDLNMLIYCNFGRYSK